MLRADRQPGVRALGVRDVDLVGTDGEKAAPGQEVTLLHLAVLKPLLEASPISN